MASTLMDVIQEFGITDRSGYFMIDNAESNDTCLAHLVRGMAPDATNDELEDAANTVLEREHERLKAWRKKRPVGNPHNATTFIRASTQRKELFKSICLAGIDDIEGLFAENQTNGLGVVKDNATRWNSTYLMINRAPKKKQEVDAFVQVLDARKGETVFP